MADTLVVLPDDLGTYLNTTVDADRAYLLLGLAQSLCESILTPLPDGAAAVILDVAARAYGNPTNVQSQGVGGFTVGYGTVGGGLWLTRQNKATLRRLAGGGGAFTIDTTPAGAGENLPPWDTGVFGDEWSEDGGWL